MAYSMDSTSYIDGVTVSSTDIKAICILGMRAPLNIAGFSTYATTFLLVLITVTSFLMPPYPIFFMTNHRIIIEDYPPT